MNQRTKIWTCALIVVAVLAACFWYESTHVSTHWRDTADKKINLSQAVNSTKNTLNIPEKIVDIPSTKQQLILQKQYIYVDSSTSFNPQTGILSVKFPTNLYNVVGFELFTCSIPRSEYIIHDANHTFSITTGTMDYVINLEKGDYDSISLAAELQAKVITATSDGSFTCLYVDKTTSYQFSSTAAAFTFNFTNSERLLQYNLGFSSQTANSTLVGGTHYLMSDHRIDLANSRYLMLQASSMKKHYINTDIIATIDMSAPLNFERRDQHMIRRFPAPIKRWRSIDISMNTKHPYSEPSKYNTNGLVFHLCFVAYCLVRDQVQESTNLLEDLFH